MDRAVTTIGDFEIRWPRNVLPEDIEDFESLTAIVLRIMKRMANKNAANKAELERRSEGK